jgi:hypothetical protein
MSVSAVLAIAGCVALLFGIVGGGIKAKEIEVPILSGKTRAASTVIGVALLGMSMWSIAMQNPANTSSPTPLPTQAASNSLPAAAAPADSATSTVAPTDTALPPMTESAAGKATAKLYEAKTWPVVLAESFDQNTAQWPLWNLDDSDKKETMQIQNGVLNWGLRVKSQGQTYFEVAPVASYSDFLFSEAVRRIGGQPTTDQAYWGMYFRAHGDHYYAFKINDLLQYGIGVSGEQGWHDLVGWTRSPLIESGTSNVLTVIADGQELYFFINGAPVETIGDATYPNGNVGLLAGLDFVEAQDTFFQFDDVELRQKP